MKIGNVDTMMDIAKVFGERCDFYMQDFIGKMITLMTTVMVVSVTIFFMLVIVGIVFWLIGEFQDHKLNRLCREKELERNEKETYYWNVIGQCADIQLNNLLDPPLQHESRNHTNAMDLTAEHFTPRKGVVSHGN